MNTYRKKALEVEAVQWTGGNREEVEAFVGGQAGSVTFDAIGRALTWMGTADPNAYFVRRPGEGYIVLASARFEEEYEPADQPAQGVEETYTREQFEAALREAWFHGFVASGEGFNGEYPFDGDVDAAKVDSANEHGARDYVRAALQAIDKGKGSEDG